MRVLVLFFFLVANTAHAEVFKCVDKSTGKTTFTDTACPDKGTGTYVPVKPTNLDTANTEAARAAQARADYERNTTSSDGRRYFGGTETEALRAAQMEQAKKGDYGDTVSQQLANEGLTPERRAAYKAAPSDELNLRQQQDEPTIRSRHDRREPPRHKQRDVAERHNERESTLCPDGSYVSGGTCKLCPDGTYVGGGRCKLAPDGSYVGGKTAKLNPNGAYTGGKKSKMCPDGSYVSGTRCKMQPDGTYTGN